MMAYSTSDLSRKSGDIIAEALRRPVTITQRSKPRLVVMSIAEYRRIMAAADTRKSFTLDEISDELLAEMEKAVADLDADTSWT
jgi:prevent-host-death family protein